MTDAVKARPGHDHPMHRALLAVLLGMLLVATPAQAQLSNPNASTPTTLYFHIFDTFNPFPINTQPMNASFFEVGGTSFPTVSNTIVSQQVGDYDFNTIRGFSTAGPVEYDFIENGRPRFHPERGIAADVQIDPAVQPVVYMYVDVRDLFSTEAEGLGLPSALPSFTFRVAVRAGNGIGDDAALDAGALIMSGQATAHVVDTQMAGQNGPFAGQTAPDGTPIFVPDEYGIVEFAIPMDIAQPVIPKADSFNVRIDWYQNPSGDAGSEDQLASGWMRLASDPAHLPRLEMAIMNPVYVEFIHPQVAAGILLIHTAVNSPWGTYDVGVGGMAVAIEGPSAPGELQRVVTQNAIVHGLHDSAAEVTYLWRFRDEGARNGEYVIRVEVPNSAGTATAGGTAGFTIEGKQAFGVDEQGEVIEPVQDKGSKDTPLPPASWLAAIVVALAAFLRRRAA